MSRVEKEQMTKHTLNLYAGDYERIRDLYPEIGAAIVIRKLIRKHIKDTVPTPEITPDKELSL